MTSEAQQVTDGYYFPISPLLLFPDTRGQFGVYIRLGKRYVLYAHPEEPFTEEQRQKLYENGVTELYVLSKQRGHFQNYLHDHLGHILLNDSLPMVERSKVFYNASVSIIRDAFSRRLPGSLDMARYQKIMAFVTEGAKFLLKDGSVKSLASLISHDYETYSHCVHVFVFTVAVLQTFGIKEEEMVRAGVGAILHDIGKILLPREVLNKNGPLSPAEWELVRRHPVQGVGLCAGVPLSQEAINVILFHHEKVDGSGYPASLRLDDIPLAVKAATVADVYDALTSDRPYGKSVKPFAALRVMRDEMRGHFDMEVLKRLVMVLSGADLVSSQEEGRLT